jgi:hypothetical protein
MSERSSGLDALLDFFVYAPVGLALVASEELPKLAARGRAQLGGQLSMAKVVGEFAVAQGRRQLASRRPPVGTTRPEAPEPPAWPASAESAASDPAPEASDDMGPSGALSPSDQPPSDQPDRPSEWGWEEGDEFGAPAGETLGDAESLAIPGYDSLAASQVVPRLAGLSADELAAVAAYESAHRARRTILNRVRQLQER